MFKHLEVDLNKIKKLSKRRERENINFRIFLKGKDTGKVDKIVHLLEKKISAQIDCKECANCCMQLYPILTPNDIKTLSKAKKMTQEDFESKYVEKDPLEDDKYLKHAPCIFLNDKLCSIYSDRPETCQSYPHIHKSRFISRSLGFIYNYEICPIVFNVIEELKQELNFRY